MEESVTYQAILEKGEARGEIKGRIVEGRRFLRILGEMRFGFADPVSELTLNTIKDPDRIERILKRLFQAKDWVDLLATP